MIFLMQEGKKKYFQIFIKQVSRFVVLFKSVPSVLNTNTIQPHVCFSHVKL